MRNIFMKAFSAVSPYRYIPSLLFIILIVTLNCTYLSFLISSDYNSTSTIESFLDMGQNKDKAKLAIIIDDFGQSRSGVSEMMNINRHLTFAVMPFLTYSGTDAKNAYKKGYEIIVHLAMEPNRGKKSWLGPRPILTVLNDKEVHKTVIDAFESVPYAVGANIHMGSKASEDERIMSDILDIIKIKGLYFVDSKTSSNNIAGKVAESKKVLFFERNVFLDGTQSKEFITKRLKQAGEIALKKGCSIAIGHVGAEGGKVTAEAISDMLPWFDEKNIELVFVSELVKSANK